MVIYEISYENGTIHALNETAGNIEYSGKDISAVLTLVNNAIPDFGLITIKEGIYNPSSQVIFTKSVKLITEGNVVFNWNITGKELFSFRGSELIRSNITADVPNNTNIIPVSDVGSAIPGDLVLIKDNTVFNPVFPKITNGELHEIYSISGNNITLTDLTIEHFSVNQSGYVYLIRPITAEIDGITINGGGTDQDYRGIRLFYNKNSMIRNSKFYNNGFFQLAIDNSYNTTIGNNSIENNTYNGFGYGVTVSLGSTYTNITNNYFSNGRHCIAQGGGSGGAGGIPRDTWIVGNTFADSTGIAHCIDSHETVESTYIYNNLIYSPIEDFAVGSAARITKVKGNIIVGGYGTRISGIAPTPIIFEVIGNNFLNSRYVFKYNDQLNKPNNIIIKDNVITGDIWGIAYIFNADSFDISGNQFNSTNTANGERGIFLQNSSNGIISNNTINNSYLSGITLVSVNNTNISNNIITNYNNLASNNEKAIKMNDSSYNNISVNTFMRNNANSYGIVESGSSDYNRIYNNDLSRVGTNISQRIQFVGINDTVKNNIGYKTENNVLSGNFDIHTKGIKTVIIPHGLVIKPNIQDCYLTIMQNTSVDDWGYDLLKVVSIDNLNVTIKIDISKASATSGATAKIGMRIGSP